jgi:hypothetical protein
MSHFDWNYYTEDSKDGGYIISGITKSNDGDITGNHGNGIIDKINLFFQTYIIFRK